MRQSTSTILALSLLTLILLASPAPGAPVQEPRTIDLPGKELKSPLEVTYIGNDGFLVAADGKKVLVDALQKSTYGYVPPSEEILSKIVGGRPPFDGLDLIVASHSHDDHFNAEMVLAVLEANPRVRFISIHGSVEALKGLAGVRWPKIQMQVENVNPAWGATWSRQVNGVGVMFYPVNHGSRANDAPYMTLNTLLDLDGARVLHVADISLPSNAGTFESLNLQEKGIDVAFADPWFLGTDLGKRTVETMIRPKVIVLMHLLPNEVERNESELAPIYPGLIVFREPMERILFR